MLRNRLIVLLTGLALVAAPGLSQAQLASPEEAKGEMAIGKADAALTVYAYESLICGFCAKFHKEALPKIKEKYVDTGKIRIVFAELPANQQSIVPAMLARCLGRERYFPVIDMFFRDQDRWANLRENEFGVAMLNYGRLAGMTEAQVNACVRDRDLQQAIIQRWLDGEKKYGQLSTPTLIVGDAKIAGALEFEVYAKAIDAALDKAAKK